MSKKKQYVVVKMNEGAKRAKFPAEKAMDYLAAKAAKTAESEIWSVRPYSSRKIQLDKRLG